MNKKKLFLMHFAGGNSYSFQFMQKELEKEFEVKALELPGRGRRMAEGLITDFSVAVADYKGQILKALQGNEPFAIYGHSMGATLGLRVAHELEQDGLSPECLIVSGNSGPGSYPSPGRYLLPSAEFVKELKVLGGMPDAFFDSPELLEFFEPILKADFEVLEKDDLKVEDFPKLHVPIHALMGSEERYVERVDSWQNFTTAEATWDVWDGNHFFIQKHTEKLIAFITGKVNAQALVQGV